MRDRTKHLIVVVAAGLLLVGAGLGYQHRQAHKNDVRPITALSIKVEDGKLMAVNIHNPQGDIIAVILPDGSVRVLKGTQEEAANSFWAALSGYIKTCSKL